MWDVLDINILMTTIPDQRISHILTIFPRKRSLYTKGCVLQDSMVHVHTCIHRHAFTALLKKNNSYRDALEICDIFGWENDIIPNHTPSITVLFWSLQRWTG